MRANRELLLLVQRSQRYHVIKKVGWCQLREDWALIGKVNHKWFQVSPTGKPIISKQPSSCPDIFGCFEDVEFPPVRFSFLFCLYKQGIDMFGYPNCWSGGSNRLRRLEMLQKWWVYLRLWLDYIFNYDVIEIILCYIDWLYVLVYIHLWSQIYLKIQLTINQNRETKFI